MDGDGRSDRVAFVLGGGGVRGANEVGMLRALSEAGVAPELVVGTSVGAINGAMIASGFTEEAVARLTTLWSATGVREVFSGSTRERMRTLVQSRTHLHGNHRLRALLERWLPVERIEEMAVPFQCVAASIERAGAHWFTCGPVVDAVLASSAVPGLLPPVEVDGEHFYDGGLVHSIPVSRAVALGASVVYVLQAGRIDQPLSPPAGPLQVGLVAFEIARRHRFVEELQGLRDGVTVHLLPAGDSREPPEISELLRYRDAAEVEERIARAHQASAAYLAAAT